MSQTFFSKLDGSEKNNRLGQLATSKTQVTIWIKGTKAKTTIKAVSFDKERQEVVLDTQDEIFSNGADVLCTFDLRGMTFFSQAIFRKSVGNYSLLQFNSDLFKSERRTSYRLLTYPLYHIWADFNLGEKYSGTSNVIDLNTKSPRMRSSQTKLFQNFIKLADGREGKAEEMTHVKVRVQDISATGLSIHISDLESKFFMKDRVYTNVLINFTDEILEIPEAKVMYVVNYISNDKNIKSYKIGINFPNLSAKIDDLLSKKINKLLRENDFNKDFENFIK